MVQAQISPIDHLTRKGVCEDMLAYVSQFANRIRLRILCRLTSGPACVSELVTATGARQSAVSQHLKLLALSGLVTRRREGQQMVYRIADPVVGETIAFLAGIAPRVGLRANADAQEEED